MPRAFQPGVFPAVGILADVPEADRGVGHDLEAALPCPLAEGVVLGQIPGPGLRHVNHRLEEGDHRLSKTLVADRQGKPLLDGPIDLAADVQEARPGVQDLAQPAALADAQLGRAGQGLAGQGPDAFAGVQAAADRQAVGPQPLDGVGMELDVGVASLLFQAGPEGVGGSGSVLSPSAGFPSSPGISSIRRPRAS